MTRQAMKNKYSAKLNHSQKSIVVASLLGDSWLEVSPNGKTARLGLELTQKSEDFMLEWNQSLQPFTSSTIERFQRKARPPIIAGPMVRNRTFFHSEFLQFYSPFTHPTALTEKGKPAKTVPTVSYLKQYLNWEMLAVLLSMDGSRKNQGRGLEIHLQGFSYEAQGRLCVALYEQLGIKCWPSEYTESSNQDSGKKKWHVTISGFSLQILHKKVLPLLVNSAKPKIPPLTKKLVTNTKASPWVAWYKTAKNAAWLEDTRI